jgi:glycosyltransferase involved in cell wall biosynthesis
MRLTVIIPSRNNACLLDRMLASVACQQFPDEQFEIIAIDNGSTDDTSAVCEAWEARFRNFRRVFEPEPGLHVGRNLGLTLARANILVYVDDDIQAEPLWLKGIAEAFNHPGVGLVGGNNQPDFESQPPPWLEQMKQRFSYGWALPSLSLLDFGISPRDISPAYVWGCNYSIRKDILMQIGGFHPDGMPKELIHLRGDGESFVSAEVVRLGMRVRFAPAASIRHFTPKSRMTETYLRDRGFRQGISKTYAVIRKYRGLKLSASTVLILSVIKSLCGRFASSNPGTKAMLTGYIDGILWHLRHCQSNADTIRWILKKNYMKMVACDILNK